MNLKRLVHKTCNMTAFLYSGSLDEGAVMRPALAKTIDGHVPAMGEPMQCGSCGNAILFPGYELIEAELH